MCRNLDSACDLLIQGNVLTSIAENFCHPDEFVQELIRPAYISLVEELSSQVESLFDRAEIDVPKYRNQSQFAKNRLKVLDHSRASERAGGNADDPCSLVNVFLQATVEDVLQQPGKTMVVFRTNDDNRIRMFHRG